MQVVTIFKRHSERLALGIVLLLFLEVIVAQEILDIQGSIRGGRQLNQNRVAQESTDAQVDPSLFCDQSSSSSFSCKHYVKSKHGTDRLAQNSPLYAGEAVCQHQYMFGITTDGVFQWKNCATNKTKVFYNSSADDVYFVLMPDASWNIYENGKLTWKEECNRDVHFYPQCLSHVHLDCPYIHLRKRGHIVINFIDKDGSWEALGAEELYDSIDKHRMWKTYHAYGN